MIFYLNTADIGYSYHVCEYSTYLVKVQYENEICSCLEKDSLFSGRLPRNRYIPSARNAASTSECAAKAKTPQALLAVFLLRLSAYSFTNRSRSYSAGMMNESELKIFSVTIGSSVGKPTSTPMTLRPLFATCTVM